MIRYALACDKGHGFESWFPSAKSFDEQAARGLVACPFCGSAKVEKALMTPQVARRDRMPESQPAPVPTAQTAPEAVPAVAAPSHEPVLISGEEQALRAKIKALREELLARSDHVGGRFAEEARRMHYGEIEHRTIHGSATPEEAEGLIDEGIAFMPLPVVPDERN